MRSDCYLAKERVNGKLAAGPTFPSGLKSLGDSIHALGLKFGVSPQPHPCWLAAALLSSACCTQVYLDCGTETCGKFPGSAGYETVDAASMAEWCAVSLTTTAWLAC